MAFDPMTGKPIEEENEDIRFDPMTGEPVNQQPVEEAAGYDPMTGEPIRQQPVEKAAGYDPMTGKPIKNNGAKKIRLPEMNGIVKIAAVFVLVVLIALIIVSSGLLRSKSGRVMLAAVNTVKDSPHFVKALKPLKILNGNKYTVVFATDNISNVDISGEVRNGGKEKQVALTLGSNGEKLELLAGVDSKSAKLSVPALSKYVFAYHYKAKNTGYLLDTADDDDVDLINAMLESIVEKADTKDLSSELYKIFWDEWKKLKFVDAGKKEYTINDKDVNCKGYTVIIKGSNMIHVVDKIEKLVNDKCGDLPDMDDLADDFDDLRNELDDVDAIEVTFYLYKNKLAAIIFEYEGENEKLEICFEGGDYRMQNMVLKMGNDRLWIAGSDDGAKEKFTLETRINGGSKSEIGNLTYNYKNGRFSINIQGMAAEGELTGSRSGLKLKINYVSMSYYRVSPELEITLKKGAKLEKYSGKEFDLGNADKDDYKELIEDIRDKVYDGDYDNIIRFLGLNKFL